MLLRRGPALIQSAERAGGRRQVVRDQHQGLQVQGRTGTNAGITKIIVKSGAAGKSKALVKGKGAEPARLRQRPADRLRDLPLIVQLRNKQNGLCWGSSFATPKKNLSTQFNAKAPVGIARS